MNTYQVETVNTETGEVVHGFSIMAPNAEWARMRYMNQPEHPHLTAELEVRVVRVTA